MNRYFKIVLCMVAGACFAFAGSPSAQDESEEHIKNIEEIPYDQLIVATCTAKTDKMREWGFERLDITMQDLVNWTEVQGINGKGYVDELVGRIRERKDETQLISVFENGANEWVLMKLVAEKAKRDPDFDPSVIEEDLEVYSQDLLMVMAINWIYKYDSLAADISQESVLSYYNENQELYMEPEQAQIRLIIIGVSDDAEPADWDKALKLGEELRERIISGEDMAQVAQQNSLGTAPVGNDLIDYFPRGTFNPELEKAAFALSVNEISPVLKLEKGIYIIKREGKKPAACRPLDESLRETIRKILIENSNRKSLAKKMKDIRFEANIESHPELLLSDKENKKQKSPFAVMVDQYFLTPDEVQQRAHRVPKTLEEAKSIVSDRIEALLLVREAERLGLNTEEAYKEVMAVAREAALKKYYEEFLQQKALLQSFSEEDYRSFYENNSRLFIQPPQRRVSKIFLPHEFPLDTPGKSPYEVGKARSESRRVASKLRDKIQQGADFAEMARKYSKDPSASEGGDLGFIDDVKNNADARMVTEIKDGEMSDLILNNQGYVLLQPTDRRPPRQMPYEECKESVRKHFNRAQKAKAVANLHDMLLSQMQVQLNPEIFDFQDSR